MKPITVLHPITRLIVGGAQENTMYTAAMLDKARFRTEVLCGPQTGSEGSLIEEVRSLGIPLTILPEMVRQINPLLDLRALIKMTRMMHKNRYQIVHTHSSKAGVLGRLAARLAGVPVILHTVHGWSFHDHMPPTLRNIYIALEKMAASFTMAMIVVAEQDIDKGLNAGIGRPDQYLLIRSAIPLEAFDPNPADRESARSELNIPPGALVVGNVGRFSAQKNPLDWVRAAGQVGRAHSQVLFLLVGDGPLRPEVEAGLKHEGISERTVLTGLRRDVPRMMAAMDIFMLSSLWEGLPRVIPQAMSMGLPVIANRADGTVEAIQDGVTGYLCTPGQTAEMAERCNYLVAHPEICKNMGQQGRIFAKKEFDLRQMIRQIEDLYERLLTRL